MGALDWKASAGAMVLAQVSEPEPSRVNSTQLAQSAPHTHAGVGTPWRPARRLRPWQPPSTTDRMPSVGSSRVVCRGVAQASTLALVTLWSGRGRRILALNELWGALAILFAVQIGAGLVRIASQTGPWRGLLSDGPGGEPTPKEA